MDKLDFVQLLLTNLDKLSFPQPLKRRLRKYKRMLEGYRIKQIERDSEIARDNIAWINKTVPDWALGHLGETK